MALRVLLSPFAIGVAFLGYFAPAALLPRYISNVFSRKITADEVNAPKAPLSEEERIKVEIKKDNLSRLWGNDILYKKLQRGVTAEKLLTY